MNHLITEPWPWYVTGPLIAFVLLTLIYFGKEFGVSGNLRTLCAMARGDRVSPFFKFDWKSQVWNLIFVLGVAIGGFIAANYMTTSTVVSINPETVRSLQELGIQDPGKEYLPPELFEPARLRDWPVLLTLIAGGILVGFGARYAGGCTSGHAISGLSNLQLPSLVAVIGFFIGGLITVHVIFPLIAPIIFG